MDALSAPFPWFGGKSRVAPMVWERFGAVDNYVEPFFGSGAVLLGRPDFDADDPPLETVNDLDGFVSNFWRALAADPEQVTHYANWPPNENDLHARHSWLVTHGAELVERLEGNPDYYDAKVAGWWVWGMALWIGGGFCSGAGPWSAVEVSPGDWRLLRVSSTGQGVQRRRLHLYHAGQGVNRKLLHLGNAGRGVTRVSVRGRLAEYMQELSTRLRRVRVCSGDWSRVCGPTPTVGNGLTGVFLDPPYSAEAGRDNNIYRSEDLSVAHDVREWAIANGDNPLMRIALCGYDTEHSLPANWTPVTWETSGGYGMQGGGAGRANKTREVVWFSPHCLTPAQDHGGHIGSLFDAQE